MAAMLQDACESHDFALAEALFQEMIAIREHLKSLQRGLWNHRAGHCC